MYSIEERDSCYGCSMTGVRRAAIHNPGAVIVFHSPAGCGQVIREKDGNGFRIFKMEAADNAPVITSNIESNDVIFGAHRKLEECLAFAVRRLHPEYILVGNSCVSGIIGDDVERIASFAGEKLKVPVFTVPCSGFMNGGYEAGLREAALCLTEAFVRPGDKKGGYVTLIGIVDKEKNYEFDFIRDILNSWHIKINCIFPGYASVREMQAIGQGKACILCSRYSMVHAPFAAVAKAVSHKAGIPMLDIPDPQGISPSLRWIEEAGRFLQVPPSLIANTSEKQREGFARITGKYRRCFSGRPACVLFSKKSSYPVCLSWFWELLDAVGIRIVSVSFSNRYTDTDRLAVMEREGLPDVEQIPFDQVFSRPARFGFIFSFGLAEELKAGQVIGIPYVNPVFGVRGLEEFYYKILKVLRKEQHRIDV